MWLTNARYLRPDGTFGHADVGVDGGVIDRLAEPGSHRGEVDCGGQLVLPGLVNGHYHGAATLLRGLDSGLDLFDWFGDTPGGREQARIGEWLDDAANLDGLAAVLRYEYLTLLRQGVTLIADSGVSEADDALPAGVGDEVGLRSVPQAHGDSIECLDPARFTVAIESEEDLTAEELDRVTRYRDAQDPVFALHCLETVARRELVVQRWGRSTVQLLAERGLLGPRSVLFHACEMDAADIETVAAAGAPIMHCPVSNLALHGRIPPAVEWYQAGITLGLGTDWGDTDMWGTLRAAWLLQQRESDRARRAAPADILRMATRGGAVGYSRDDLGEIVPGRTADLVFVDTERIGSSVNRTDVSTLAFALLTDGGAGIVRHVMVGGDWSLYDGESTRVDSAATVAEYRRIAAGLTG